MPLRYDKFADLTCTSVKEPGYVRQNEFLPHKDSAIVNSKGQPQAKVVVAVRRAETVTKRRETVIVAAVPATATDLIYIGGSMYVLAEALMTDLD